MEKDTRARSKLSLGSLIRLNPCWPVLPSLPAAGWSANSLHPAFGPRSTDSGTDECLVVHDGALRRACNDKVGPRAGVSLLQALGKIVLKFGLHAVLLLAQNQPAGRMRAQNRLVCLNGCLQ
jgi:hypothetical protein